MGFVECSVENVLGKLMAAFDADGVRVTKEAVEKLTSKEKVVMEGVRAADDEMYSAGVFKDFEEVAQERVKQGISKSGRTAYFRNPAALFGDDIVKPIIEAAEEFEAKVLKEGLNPEAAQKLYKGTVAKKVAAQKAKYMKAGTPDRYIQSRANQYFDDMLEGAEYFRGASNDPMRKIAKTTAGNITGLNPVIAFFDYKELLDKGLTIYGYKNFFTGLARSLKNPAAAFERNKEVLAINGYTGQQLLKREQSKFAKGAEWLTDHLDPQYYSNNFVTNAAYHIGQAAGVPEREAIEKIVFKAQPGNAPEYMRHAVKDSADYVWARYTVEASKFYLQNWANLGRAIKSKDAKATVNAMGALATFYATGSIVSGTRSTLPSGVDWAINYLAGDDPEETGDIFDDIDNALPFNLIHKTTGVDFSSRLQPGLPMFGLAWGAANSTIEGIGRNGQKAAEAAREGDWMAAGKASFLTLHAGLSARFRNPLLTKTVRELTELAIDYASGEIDDEGVPERLVKEFAGKEALKKYKSEH